MARRAVGWLLCAGMLGCAEGGPAASPLDDVVADSDGNLAPNEVSDSASPPLHPVRTLSVPSHKTAFAEVGASTIPRRAVGGYLSAGVSAGDLNGDEIPDLVAPNGNQILVWAGNGSVILSNPVVVYESDPTDFALGTWTYDFDQDGRLDLLFGGWNGLTILHNDGGMGFSRTDDTLGLALRRDLLTNVNVLDLNGDGRMDLFLGYVTRQFSDAVLAAKAEYAAGLEDEIYLQRPDGRFELLPMPAASVAPVQGYGWYTLHSVPLDGGLLVLGDVGQINGPHSAWFQVQAGAVQAHWMKDVLAFVEAPMGGFCHTTADERTRCWFSDLQEPKVFERTDRGWFAVGQALGIHEAYFSWSVSVSDFDLDLHHDVAVTLGHPFFGDTPIPDLEEERRAGLVVYEGNDSGFTRTRLASGHFIGMTRVDLDGDGVPEIVAREVNAVSFRPGSPSDGALRVFRKQSDIDRVQVQFDVSCLGAEVSYGASRRRLEPYTNAGSFGNGTYSLSFPFQEDEVMTVAIRGRSDQQLVPRRNVAESVRCDTQGIR